MFEYFGTPIKIKKSKDLKNDHLNTNKIKTTEIDEERV